jgi:hypothetical protein
MFAAACTRARQFTRPVIISHQRVDNQCGSSIGAYVVVNRDGWFITAHHIIQSIRNMEQTGAAIQQYETDVAAIEGDRSLSRKERQRRLAQYNKPPADAPRRFSPWWGHGLVVAEAHDLPEVDLSVGRFASFDPSTVGTYPVFKDPGMLFEPGISLCKLGYPFHEIVPTFDPASGFTLPPGSLPIPQFPLEGMFTRLIQIPSTSVARTYPTMFLETSSPGLRGQSGGPTFDSQGTVFAIQSRTMHYPLGFDTYHVVGKKRELIPQFLNVGWGVHVATVVGFLTELGVQFQVSGY